jgi:polar amino acid transport system substrate-binding protein
MKKVLITVLAVLLALSVLAGCSSSASQSADESLNYITDKGTIVLGLDASFPPMGFKDDSGNIVGFDIDLAKEVASRMGVELELQPIDWSAKELELNNKNIDLIWNGLTITPERQESMLMSEPYMENKQIVVVLKDSDIQSLSDLEGKDVAVQDGSSAQDALAADGDLLSKINQIDFKDNVTALLDLKNGQVDALAVDSIVADYYTSQEPDTYRILDEALAPEEYGIGFRKGEQAFADAVQKALDEMKEDGTFEKISMEWFGKNVAL